MTSVSSRMNQQEHLALILKHKQAYEEGSPLISDREYNKLEDSYLELYGDILPVGSPPVSNKVALPCYIGGTTKIKSEAELQKWAKKNGEPVIVSAKIDGIAGILIVKDGLYSLLTRGDGVSGMDMSHVLEYLNLPDDLPDMVVRGELTITLEDFEPFRGNEQGQYRTPRVFASGITHAIKGDPIRMQMLKFVAFEILCSKLDILEQNTLLETYGFEQPLIYELADLPEATPLDWYEHFQKHSPYDIDGLVYYGIAPPVSVVGRDTAGIVAYKFDEDGMQTTVTGIRWKASANGALIPVINFETVVIDGSDVSWATGHNYNWLTTMGASVGASVEVIKGGKTIPKVIRLLEAGTGDYQIPPGAIVDGNNLRAPANDPAVNASTILAFLKKMDIKGVGKVGAFKLVEAGIRSITKLYKATYDELKDVLKTTGARALFNGLRRDTELIDLMKASNLFPRIAEKSLIGFVQEILERDGGITYEGLMATIPGKSKASEVWNARVPKLVKFLEAIKDEVVVRYGDYDIEE